MPARLRLLEELSPGCERPLCLLDGLMWPHGKRKVAKNTNLVRNTDGGFSLLLYGRCAVRFYQDYMELRFPRVTLSGEAIPAHVLADRLAGVLRLWGAEIISAPPENISGGVWFVLRAGQAERLVDGLRFAYKVEAGVPAGHEAGGPWSA